MNCIKTYFTNFTNLRHYASRHFPVTIIKNDNSTVFEWAETVFNDGENLVIDTADGRTVPVKFAEIKSLRITAR